MAKPLRLIIELPSDTIFPLLPNIKYVTNMNIKYVTNMNIGICCTHEFCDIQHFILSILPCISCYINDW